MTSLALLFARCHEVEGSGFHGLVGCFGLCHRAVGKVLWRLLVPIAHIAGMMNLIERNQRECVPFVGIDTLATGIDGEAQLVVGEGGRDATQDLISVTNEQWC